ncbi:MAG TPA: translation elongation factor Ts [Candidatus Eremiobacteraeota bacterium]|nr:translation elongation factor Ts [Candidatus Eremiobacteraeota bacterium]
MAISASLVKDLRDKTGAGVMDCRRALEDTDGNMDEAVKLLRHQGLKTAAKKSSRVTGEGQIGSYIHFGGKLGVLVEVNCETDFVAKTEEFHHLVKDISMHVAALNPRYLSREDIPEEVIKEELEIYKKQAKDSGKPDNILEKIAQGKLEKFYKSCCLLDQAFVKDESKCIQEVLTEVIAKLGENIKISRFIRFEVGQS